MLFLRPVNSGVMPLLFMNMLTIIFEVMDKEPSLTFVWVSFLLIGAVGFLLSHYRIKLSFVVLTIALFVAYIHLMELHDPSVGPAIVREAGQTYVAQSYIALAISVILPCLGIMTRRKKLP
jgi:hypothetical protein